MSAPLTDKITIHANMEPHLLIAAQLYATTAVQTGFYLPLCLVLFYLAFLWAGYERIVRNYY